MISFRIQPHHARPGTNIVEILVDGEMAASIYPDGDNGVKIISAHFKDLGTERDFSKQIVIDPGTDPRLPIPAIHFMLEPSPYTIDDGKIVRLPHG